MFRVYAFALLTIVTWLAWVLQFLIMRWLGRSWDIANAGSWGDTFGALNALFAAIAAIGVIYTLRLQQKQIAEAEIEQHKQRFERTFFELLRLLREEREKLRFQYSGDYLEKNGKSSAIARAAGGSLRQGSMAVRSALLEARFWIEKHPSGAQITRDEVAGLYQKHVHGRYESSFGPYFRLIYTILNRIRNDRILNDSEKADYARLLRSQLTSHEAGLAGINGLAPFSKDFSSLVTEFRLLKYLKENTLKDTLRKFYPDQAFEARD